MSQTEIPKMDFKELRNEVQKMRDELAIALRKYEDILYNLDNDNFSVPIIKEKEEMKKGIDLVTNEVYPDGTESESAIKVSADKIETKVSKTLNFGEAQRGSVNPLIGDMSIYDTEKLYYYITGDSYYYYNTISNEWEEVDGDSIYSAFRQTASGFELKGNVEIDGSLITNGTITANKINTSGLGCEKIYEAGNPNGGFMKIHSEYGDFGVYDGNAGSSDMPDDSSCIFGVLRSDPFTGAVNFYSFGHNFMGYNNSQSKFYPKSDWDFSSSNIVGLYVTINGTNYPVWAG